MGKCDGKQEIDIIQSETNAISVCNHNVKPILHNVLGLCFGKVSEQKREQHVFLVFFSHFPWVFDTNIICWYQKREIKWAEKSKTRGKI